jgi:hypothetical protein
VVTELANLIQTKEPEIKGFSKRTRNKTNTADECFAKKRVQWLIVHSTSHQILWYVDSLVVRNPLLRKAADRWWQPQERPCKQTIDNK